MRFFSTRQDLDRWRRCDHRESALDKQDSKVQGSKEIDKVFGLKVIETLQALQLLRDAICAVREGKLYHLPVLSGQMRSLLIDKTKHSERLLLHVSQHIGIQLIVFCGHGVDDPSYPLKDKPVFWVSGFPITADRKLATQREMPIERVLLEPFVLYQGIQYTPKTIIEWFANRAGGSHYSKSMPRPFAEMLTLNLGAIKPLPQMLLQLAEATLIAGQKFLRAVVPQELHLLIALPASPRSEVFLLDASYPESAMRLSILLNARGTPAVRLVGLDGSSISLVGSRLVTWEEPHHLQLTINITEDLTTRVELHLDGENLGHSELRSPLFLVSDWVKFDVCHNKAVDGEPQDFRCAFGEVALYASNLSPYDRASMLLYIGKRRRDPDLKLLLYEEQSFGRSPPGERDIMIQGAARQISAKDLLAHTSESSN